MGTNLFDSFPANQRKHLIVRKGRAGLYDYSLGFREAADRLASTFTGQPFDDTIFMPWLYMHRHATELVLKDAIVVATRLRRRGGDTDPTLGIEETQDRLKRKLGHKLVPLVDELDTHLRALELETTPQHARKMLARLAQLDPSGEAFRYSGSLPKEDDRVDFPSFHTALREMVDTLSGALDVLDVYADYQGDMFDSYSEGNELRGGVDVADYTDF